MNEPQDIPAWGVALVIFIAVSMVVVYLAIALMLARVLVEMLRRWS